MKFSCPSCDGHIDAGPDWAGQTTECPHCGESITVPEEVANEQAAVPPAPVPPNLAPASAAERWTKPRTSGLATGSLICGILTFFLAGITALPAVIMGHKARGQIRRDPALGGDGLAVAGLVLGYIGMVYFVAMVGILASISVPVYNSIAERAKITKIISNAKQVVLGLRTYAINHDGKFPETLDQLVPDYISEPEILHYASFDVAELEEFIYFPGFTDSSPGATIVVATAELARGKRVIARADGSAKAISEAEYQALTAGRSP